MGTRHTPVNSVKFQTETLPEIGYSGGMTHTYTIILEPAEEGGFIVTVPALPEVGTQGETRDEALANAREAIELVLEHRVSSGEPVPADVVPTVERVTVAA